MDQAYLELHRNGRLEVVHLPGDRLLVGRAPRDGLALPTDDTVSREHAVLERLPHGWMVRDNGSTHGTAVNGRWLSGPRQLQPGDEIAVGRCRMVFRLGGPPGPPMQAGGYLDASDKAIESFVEHWNSDCGPIAWTATADEILDKVRTITSRMEALLRALSLIHI